MIGNHTESITWLAIDGYSDLPESEAEVLVYDTVLDDVVMASFGGEAWYDVSTGDALPDPRYWAKKPFPAGV